MAERGTLGDGIAAKITMPVLPRYPSASVSANRNNNTSSPMRPSPLRESSLAAAIEKMAIEETPKTTPISKEASKSNMVTDIKDITPPESSKAEPLVIVDSSGTNIAVGPRAASANDTYISNNDDFNIMHHGMDDPFVSPVPKRLPQAANPLTPSQNTIARIQANIAVPSGNGFSPRFDRLGQPITAANAQGVLPPEALVFVANLSNRRADDQLEISCHQAFDTFGKCHVKIKRDRNNQPYAFVQFEQIADADLAVKEARGLSIDGRACRTEHAKAARAIVLVRLSGGQISEEEAHGIMDPFGPIAETAPVTLRDQQELGMPAGGLWIKFAFFQDCKDAIWNFKHSEHYHVHIPPSDPKPVRPFNNGSPGSGVGSRSASDERSIFLGGLPDEVYEDQLRQIFASFGIIDMVTIMRKPGPRGALNIFAFVEFRHPEEAQTAARAEVMIGPNKIRVERKEYTARRNARLMAASPPSPAPYSQPPTPPSPAALHAIHNYALQLGLAPHQAATILGIGQQSTPPFLSFPTNTLTPATRFYPVPAAAGTYSPYGSPMYAVPEEDGREFHGGR